MSSMIDISQKYKSSTRLDNDAFNYKDFIDSFILHGTALNVLDTISRDFTNSEQRCFTITGPYGTGKSTIALFLTQLLSDKKTVRNYANKKLIASDGENTFQSSFNVKKGWKVVKHVCGLNVPSATITCSILQTLEHEFNEQDIFQLNDDECLSLIASTLDKGVKVDGVIILLDEMGKALDYQSRENKDLYFFQNLADVIQKSKTPAILIGFLHQAFSEYSKAMNASAQKDWAKVQGRYRDMGYIPSIDESLVLIGDSIAKTSEVEKKLVQDNDNLISSVLSFFPSQTDRKAPLLNSLPLDPIVSLLLGPISKRSFSQNERSLFGFLASNEKMGFKQFIEQHYPSELNIESKKLDLFHPELFWDYLQYNLNHIILASSDSKVWLEGQDAIYRAEQKGSDLHCLITKTIALLTLFGFQHQLFAKRKFLISYFSSRGFSATDVTLAIKELEEWTVIIYRQKHDALFVFQGSDIDINQLISVTIEEIKDGVDWTSQIAQANNILATAHYHKTGTMRWAQTKTIGKHNFTELESLDTNPISGETFLWFVLPVEESLFERAQAIANTNEHIILGHQSHFSMLKTQAIELIALNKVLREHKEISHDFIAKNEINHRIEIAKQSIFEATDKAFKTAQWEYDSLSLNNKTLTSITSEIADHIFNKAPVIKNELVNRSKPSGSANSAIKKLLIAMSENFEEENLNLPDGSFPAEKGLYFSCLKNQGLHAETEGKFEFNQPKDINLKALFDSANLLIKARGDIVWLNEIDNLWSQKPFGVPKGIRTIWILAFVMTHLKDFAFFDKNDATNEHMFITAPDEEFVIKLMLKSSFVGVQLVQVDQEKTAYLNELALALPNFTGNPTPLAIAQEYVTLFASLSTWTRNTKSVSKAAKDFILYSKTASDPHDYLFEKLTSIFTKKTIIDIRSNDIKNILNEVINAHMEMVKAFKTEITIYLPIDAHLLKQCTNVTVFTSDAKLQTFAQRLGEFASNNNWVSNIISLLSGKAERNWDDNAINKAKTELIGIIERFKLANYQASFKALEYKSIRKDYNSQIISVEKSLSTLEEHERRAVLMALLDEMTKGV
ncbi:AAA family ATPase [Colwellia sp. C1TZA3]|uniref:AAA family ATPase n=1 Tax=Colwellia sp. C1TZA3 TaxID=2508879 RepID=UPI00174A913F|nr:AAA family ATPase [Colwellia sp. C1TZA3]